MIAGHCFLSGDDQLAHFHCSVMNLSVNDFLFVCTTLTTCTVKVLRLVTLEHVQNNSAYLCNSSCFSSSFECLNASTTIGIRCA